MPHATNKQKEKHLVRVCTNVAHCVYIYLFNLNKLIPYLFAFNQVNYQVRCPIHSSPEFELCNILQPTVFIFIVVVI